MRMRRSRTYRVWAPAGQVERSLRCSPIAAMPKTIARPSHSNGLVKTVPRPPVSRTGVLSDRAPTSAACDAAVGACDDVVEKPAAADATAPPDCALGTADGAEAFAESAALSAVGAAAGAGATPRNALVGAALACSAAGAGAAAPDDVTPPTFASSAVAR